jgi:hypothetical protein
MNRIFIGLLLSACIPAFGAASQAADSVEVSSPPEHDDSTGRPVVIGDGPQLFLDDHLVADMKNLNRHVCLPRKSAKNPVLTCEHPWEARRIYNPVVLYEPETKTFRMWYTAFADAPGDYPGVICYAESDDGLNWRKPMMRIRPYEGELPTNILLDGPAEAIFLSVIKTPHDPKRPYKGMYWHRRYPEKPGIYGNLVTHSTDGIHWSPPRLVIHGKSDTFPSLVWYEPAGKYFAFLRDQARHADLAGHVRVTGISESRDFENWTSKKMRILTTEDEGYPYTQFHALTVNVYADLLLGQASVLRLEEQGNNFLGVMNVQLACSRDGWTWHRVADRAVFLDIGPDEWDRWYVHAASLAVKDDVVYVYYNGYPVKHGFGKGQANRDELVEWPCTMIGVATLPADRFVALRLLRDGVEGALETPLLQFTGSSLLVNADVPDGGLQVELLDGTGGVLAGFDRSRSRLVAHDNLRRHVTWDGPSDSMTLRDAAHRQPLALRFVLREGSLYAFEIRS